MTDDSVRAMVAGTGLNPGLLLEHIGLDAELENEVVARALGLTAQELETIREELRAQLRDTAARLLADPEVADAAARLPFRRGETVVVFGDSISSCADSWANLLATVLDERGVRLVNRAVAGRTTCETFPAVGRALDFDPDWTIIALGGNDVRRQGGGDGVRMASIEETIRNLGELSRMVSERAPTRVVLIPSIMAVDPARVEANREKGSFWEPDEVVESRRRVLAAFPEAIDAFSHVPTEGDYWAGDGVHPTSYGQELLFRMIVPALARLNP